MFYAGPREAVHHTKIREKLGFEYFSIGRDHAGANNAYDPAAAQVDKQESHQIQNQCYCSQRCSILQRM